MPNSSHSLLHYLRIAVGAYREDARNDTELLAHFADTRDEMAFAVLVWRHGTLVWGTCRRILGNTPDAEDAFQATFLDLAREAGRSPVKNLAGWLHQVARRTALDLRSKTRRGEDLGRQLWTAAQPVRKDSPDRTELYAAIDEELASLPEKLRVPLVLHYLEGMTQNEVARILGCSRTLARRRLAKGEALLRERLERRGLSVGIGSIAVLLRGTIADAAVPALVVHSTVKAALGCKAVPAADGFLSAWTANSAQWFIRTFGVGKPLPLLLGVAALGAILAGAGIWAYQHKHTNISPATALPTVKLSPVVAPREKPKRQESTPPSRLDLFGAPLPEHAVARMGMARFRHANTVTSVAYAPDAKTIASASWDKTIRIWDALTGKELRKFQGHEGSVAAVAFAPDGKTLASCSADKTIRLWDVATGRQFRRLTGHQQPVIAIAFSPNGKELASASLDQTVRIWDVAAGRELHRLKGHRSSVWAVAFSADGQTVVSGGEDGSVRLWNVRSGKETGKLEGHRGMVTALAFSPDRKTLASGDGDGTIWLWEVITGKQVRKLQAPLLPGHERGVSALAFAPDGQTLVSGNRDWTMRFWNVHDGTELRTAKAYMDHYSHMGPVSSLTFSLDGKFLVSGGGDRAIRLWESNTGKQIQNWQGHTEDVCSVVFAPDGRTLASASLDNAVRLWDAATGRQLRQLDGLQGSVIYMAVFSPDGKTLAIANHDWTVCLWDAATGKEVQKLEGHTEQVSSVSFAPDGKTLASAGYDKTIRIWDLDTGKELHTLRHTAWVHRAAFSPDSKKIASVGWDQAIALWDAATGERVGKLEGHEEKVVSVAFSPDGKALASASWDGTVRVWDVAAGKEIRKLAGHQSGVLCVAFAPRGRYVASGGWDGMVRLWELASGRECARLNGHEGQVCSLTFSSDGRRLASGGGDHTVLIWDLTGRSRKRASAARLGLEDLERLWSDLASADAARAYQAGWILASVPDRAMDLFQQHLRETLRPSDSLRLIVGQDAAKYPGLGARESEDLRLVRVVAVLEWIGTDQAKELLREVAERARQSQATLDRELSRRP
jgi:RNA polymerase sigma factor (sigma-70 family)